MRLQAWNRVRKDCASIVLANMYRRFKSRRELGRLSWKIQARRQKQVSEQHETHALRLQCWWRVYLASRLYMYSVRHHIEIIPDLSKRRLHYPDSSPDSVMATHGVRYKEIIYVGIIAITTRGPSARYFGSIEGVSSGFYRSFILFPKCASSI